MKDNTPKTPVKEAEQEPVAAATPEQRRVARSLESEFDATRGTSDSSNKTASFEELFGVSRQSEDLRPLPKRPSLGTKKTKTHSGRSSCSGLPMGGFFNQKRPPKGGAASACKASLRISRELFKVR